MEIAEVLFYSVVIGVVGGILNGERFGFYVAFAAIGGLCLAAGVTLWAIDMGSDSFAIVMIAVGVGQIIYLFLTSKK